MRRSRSPIKIDQPNKVIQGDFKMQLMEVLTDWNTLRREAYESGSTIYWKIKRFCFLWDPKWKSLLKEKKKKKPTSCLINSWSQALMDISYPIINIENLLEPWGAASTAENRTPLVFCVTCGRLLLLWEGATGQCHIWLFVHIFDDT